MDTTQSTINTLLTQLEMHLLPFSEEENAFIIHWAESNTPLYQSSLKKNPEHSPMERLLGVVTYSYRQNVTTLENNAQSIIKMQAAISTTVGNEFKEKFGIEQLANFITITKLWMVMHGTLQFEFSLTNDHAREAATLVHSLNNQSIELLRTEFLSFYYSANNTPKKAESVSLLSKIKNTFRL